MCGTSQNYPVNNFLNVSENNPVGIYLLKVNNRKTRTRCEICSKLMGKVKVLWAFACSKLTIETLEQGVKYVQS